MKKYVQTKFSPDGKLVLSVMLGPYDRHPVGSREWAEGLTMHLQSSLSHLQRDSNPRRVLRILQDALTAHPHPWQVYPEEAKGDPEMWLRMATLLGWGELEAQVKPLDPDGWNEIASQKAWWEAEHRRPGNPTGANQHTGGTVCDTHGSSDPEDGHSARGIRRRLVKRAKAGDTQAAELVEQLKAGTITVNQAAIAAGMRQVYMRVRMDDAAKAAEAMLQKMGAEWCQGFVTSLVCKLPLN